MRGLGRIIGRVKRWRAGAVVVLLVCHLWKRCTGSGYQFVAIASQLTATGCQKAAALLYCPLPSTDKISPLSLPE
ncbi:hypothetical protein GRJ2_003203300 [Grus japonensis]|uniref:Secreted protein n=1 Tax=Grus japonensis TaxID=30415 RepID=A0ABC9YCR9_GRUJA